LIYYLGRTARCRCPVNLTRTFLGAALCVFALVSSKGVDAATRPPPASMITCSRRWRIHLLSAPDTPEVTTTLTATDVARILSKINRVWAQAGMHFYLGSSSFPCAAGPKVGPARQEHPGRNASRPGPKPR